jgi:hypothetical protein
MKCKRGQSVLEYGFLIACIAAAVLGMQFYVKRAIQGRIKQTADQIGSPYDAKNSISYTTTYTNATTTSSTYPVNITSITGMVDQYGMDVLGTLQQIYQSVNITTHQDENVRGGT